jgi:putative lipoic acid-binding regulatory protein
LSEPDRQRSIDLLNANHVFPGDYPVSVIALNAEPVATALAAAASQGQPGPLSGEAHQVRPSANGKYVSHRFTLRVQDAEAVLDLYARLRAIDGVITVF